MNARIALFVLLTISGCWNGPPPQRPQPKPVEPESPVVVQDDKFDAKAQSAALARLAERQSRSASIRDGTRRLNGILAELLADGVPKSYIDAVRSAVPAIKPPTKDSPARNLTADEIQALRSVK